MSAETQTIAAQEIVYPESDGKPMADNTKQFRWIVTIQGGLDALFKDDPNVFVAGDLLWYPVEGQPSIRLAPDVLVAFGRPKGDRGSYQQWREDGIAPQVVFEVLSPGNTLPEMLEKLRFYERYSCEEFYLYDPDRGALSGWVGGNGELATIETIDGWLSPRLGVRFQLVDGDLQLYYPDGRRFESYVELERSRATAQARAERLAAQLRALGIAPDEG
jgi:Uma2 family endonuclease